jgi:hypothetical protein
MEEKTQKKYYGLDGNVYFTLDSLKKANKTYLLHQHHGYVKPNRRIDYKSETEYEQMTIEESMKKQGGRRR